MTLRMAAAGKRAAALVGTDTPYDEKNWCLRWCVRNVYDYWGACRWGGNGKPWAINYWDAAKRWGRVVETSDPAKIPRGAMTFSKGSEKYGHVFIADGEGGCYTTDYPVSTDIGHVSIERLMKAWGHRLLGYIEITGEGFDLREPASSAVDRMDPANYGPKGVSGEHVTWYGQRLVAHGYGRFYKVGPGPKWGKADEAATRAFQADQGWDGDDADGLPGRETLRRAAAAPKPRKGYPADVFGKGWKAQLVSKDRKKAIDVKQPELATFSSPYLFLDVDGAVVFRAYHGAATTKGSKNSRSEIREMTSDGTDEIGWDSDDGRVHSLDVELAVTRFTKKRPIGVLAQIHDEDDDVTVLRAEKIKGSDRFELWLTKGDTSHGKKLGTFELGERFRFGFVVEDGLVHFTLNGKKVEGFSVRCGDGAYFKLGAYVQSNPETAPGESRDEYLEVKLYGKPKVKHARAA